MAMKYSDIVDYDKLDPYKEKCIRRFRDTLVYSQKRGVRILEETLGETAVAIDTGDPKQYLAFNVEGLGTKNRISETMGDMLRIFMIVSRAYGVSHGMDINQKTRQLFSGIGQCGEAASVNDLCGIGALPFLYAPIVATGSSDYLTDPNISDGLIEGFERAASLASTGIPCGETPTLQSVVYANTIDLAGASLGIINPRERLCIGAGLKPGLTIYGVASSGIHCNGLSLARRIVERLPDGFFTKLPSGRMIGEVLLTPTKIYAGLIQALQEEEAEIVYGQPVTGHGFGKIMRKKKDLCYVIEDVPEPQEEFKFLQEYGPIDVEELYRAFNMNVGFVLIAHHSQGAKIMRAGDRSGNQIFELGPVKRGKRSVKIPSLGIAYRPGKAKAA